MSVYREVSELPRCGSCGKLLTVGGLEVEQCAPQRGALVVVAGHPDHRRIQTRGHRLDRRTQGGVRVGLAEVGQISGEDDGIGTDAGGLGRLEGAGEVEVRLVMTPPWSPDKMTEDARDQLGIF